MARSRALLNVLQMTEAEKLPPEQLFLNELRYSIEQDVIKGTRKASMTYKPSSLHCIRNMWFQLTGTTPNAERQSADFSGICESGTDRHIRIQTAIERMRKNGFDCDYVDVESYIKSRNLDYLIIKEERYGHELKLYDTRYNISFMCDGIIKFHGKYYIFEFKTESSSKFWDHDNVRLEHYLQGTAYSLCLGISDVMFLYENRDICNKKSYILQVTDKMRNDLINKISECNGYRDREECPPKPDTVSKKDCAYCNYSMECKKYE